MTTPTLHPYRVHCAGLQYITLARSDLGGLKAVVRLPG